MKSFIDKWRQYRLTRRLERDVAFSTMYAKIRSFDYWYAGHEPRVPDDPDINAALDYKHWCASTLVDLKRDPHRRVDDELIHQWRLRAVGTDIRAMSGATEAALLFGVGAGCGALAGLAVGAYLIAAIAGVLAVVIAVYIWRYARSTLVVGPDAIIRLPLWAMPHIDIKTRVTALRMVNRYRI